MKRFLFIVLCGIGCGSMSFADTSDSSAVKSDNVAVQTENDAKIKSDTASDVVDATVTAVTNQEKVEPVKADADVPVVGKAEEQPVKNEVRHAGEGKISACVNVVFDEAANSIDIGKMSTELSDKIVELEKNKSEFPAQASEDLGKFITIAKKISVSDLSKMSADDRTAMLDDLSCAYNALMVVLEETL